MPDKDGTPDLDGSVAPTLSTSDAELLPAVMDFARQVAHRLGPRDGATEHTVAAVEAACPNVVTHAFDPAAAGQHDNKKSKIPLIFGDSEVTGYQ